MSDLVFRQGINTTYGASTFNVTSPNELREDVASGVYNLRDVVRITYVDQYLKSVYAICTNASGAATFTFDNDIYPVQGASITSVNVYVYNSVDIINTESYRLGVSIENGLYSKAYTQYANNISYSLIIPSKKREYFGTSSLVLTQSNVVFADYCDKKAYGVGISELSLNNLNNKFKSELEFNIATR